MLVSVSLPCTHKSIDPSTAIIFDVMPFNSRVDRSTFQPTTTNQTSIDHYNRHDAHCMVPAVSALAAMGALHPEANPALAGAFI